MPIPKPRHTKVPLKLLAEGFTGKAYAFVCSWKVAGLGHIGWGFSLKNGEYVFGGTENLFKPEAGLLGGGWGSWHQGTSSQGGDNEAWVGYGDWEHMLTVMKYADYDNLKWQTTHKAQTKDAHKAAVDNLSSGFTGLGNNCLDATYRVLEAYGCQNLPWKQTNPTPMGWFRSFGSSTAAELDGLIKKAKKAKKAH